MMKKFFSSIVLKVQNYNFYKNNTIKNISQPDTSMRYEKLKLDICRLMNEKVFTEK